jgi:hypothetical protein
MRSDAENLKVFFIAFLFVAFMIYMMISNDDDDDSNLT